MSSDSRDQIYAEPHPIVEDFIFDESVVRVFPDMIRRSVPGYATLVEMIGRLAGELLQPGSRCYDLGCSLGAVSYAVAHSGVCPSVEILAVDNAPSMIAALEQRLVSEPPSRPVRTLCTDVRELTIEDASLVVLNLTLQFIEPAARLDVLRNIRAGLQPGGTLILSEKIRLQSAEEQEQIDHLQQMFKRSHGYSDLEISQKRAALECVLLPESVATHRRRLKKAGFSGSLQWFQCLNFVSLLAWA
jgi:tRNA (cmo5U34)-methyltransferase